jgi:hypothetical protein
MFKSTSDVQKERFAETFKENGGNNAVGTAQAAPSSSIHDLKSRLQARIEALKQSRIQSSGKPGKSREQILQERKERKDGSKPNQADKSAKSTGQSFKRKLDASAEPAASHDGASNPTLTEAITFNKLAIGEGQQKKKKQKLDPKAALQKIERNKAKTEKQKQSIDADQVCFIYAPILIVVRHSHARSRSDRRGQSWRLWLPERSSRTTRSC